jgi:predicted Fe-Mo cluster-binding NifX family protein
LRLGSHPLNIKLHFLKEIKAMKLVVSATGSGLDAAVSPVFGRCPYYVFVDTDTMQYEAVPNPAISASGGAGIQAAQFVVERGAQAVLTGNVGPNAFNVLQAAGVPVYTVNAGTVREAVEAYKAGQLPVMAGPNSDPFAGMGGQWRRGGRGTRRSSPSLPITPSPGLGTAAPAKEDLAELKEQAAALRQQLAEVMARIEKLEKGKS